MIPQASPGLQYRRHQAEIDAAIARVLQSGWFILGPEVEAFESEFAAFCGAERCVGVGSGTDAIRLALLGLGIGAGDEVIVPAHTAVATVAAVERAGATPRLVDIEPDTYAIDPGAAAAAVTPLTRAIIAVHLYGQPANLGALHEVAASRGLALVEDCAQAHGACWQGKRVGALATVGCFSFYPTKNLGALGDGGAVVTRDVALAERVALLRQYGWEQRNRSSVTGDNSRLDEIQAAVLRAKLRALEPDTVARQQIASAFGTGLQDVVDPPVTRPGATHVYHLYVLALDDRDGARQRLETAGVGTAVHYPYPIHLQPAYEGRIGRRGEFPVAERACTRVVSLPLYPGLDPAQVDRIVSGVRQAVRR